MAGQPVPTGTGYICLDATPLIAFNRVGKLDLLGQWFPVAFTPNVVIEEELRPHLAKYPDAKKILDAEWLQSVPVESDRGIKLVSYLRDDLWRSDPTKDRGEAEVLALCRDYGWIAGLDDEQARVAAARKDIKVPSVMLLTIIVAAAAHDMIGRKDALKLHVEIDEARKAAGIGSASFLTSGDVHRPAFMNSIDAFRTIHSKQQKPPWPSLLAVPRLDSVIIKVRKES